MTVRLVSRSYYHRGIFYNRKLVWKDMGVPRVGLTPAWIITLYDWQLVILFGTPEEWEWKIWVKYYNNGDIKKAKETWPWETLN